MIAVDDARYDIASSVKFLTFLLEKFTLFEKKPMPEVLANTPLAPLLLILVLPEDVNRDVTVALFVEVFPETVKFVPTVARPDKVTRPLAPIVVNEPVFAVVAPTVPLCAPKNGPPVVLPIVVFPDTVNRDVTVALFVEVFPDTVKFPVWAKIPVEVIVLPAAPSVVLPDTVRLVDTVARPVCPSNPVVVIVLPAAPNVVLPDTVRFVPTVARPDRVARPVDVNATFAVIVFA